ncbi:hypothetical protein Bhyg_08268 [Pseudolycoriella hygida]|uniref:Uncharacterized protein n=1 Tax=Pseudolycoriella hygida TaxID=35572 RepID=A0A9Q0N4A0_9DIPT|nr:hypothetical protein Bhyg_08268 [Pseudolycoriella hygida]
MKPAMNRSGLS